MTERAFISAVARMHHMSESDAERGIKALRLLNLSVANWIANQEMFRSVVNATK